MSYFGPTTPLSGLPVLCPECGYVAFLWRADETAWAGCVCGWQQRYPWPTEPVDPGQISTYADPSTYHPPLTMERLERVALQIEELLNKPTLF